MAGKLDELESQPEMSEQGKSRVLDVTLAAQGLSTLGLSAKGLEFAYLHLSLPGYALTDVSILTNYTHIQKLDLSHNNIHDISCLGCLQSLVILNVSDNNLTELCAFSPLSFLREADFSFNQITDMANLSGFPRLCKLVINQNEIVSLWGLEKCDRLSYLSLAYNRIKRAAGLGRLPLTYLCLRNNDLENILGMDGLLRLQELDVSYNQICSLQGLEGLQFLHIINLESNCVADQQETRHLQALSLLRNLDIRTNPIQDGQEYRLHTIFNLQKLTKLDGEIVTIKEKVTAINKFGPPAEVVAAQDHITNKVFALLQPQKIYHSTPFSINCPYPMLVLTGPLAGGKQELAQWLCEEFGEYLGRGTRHTTRQPYPGEEEGREYHFVTARKFGDMTLQGRFIETSQHDGELYGLSMDAVEELAGKGLSCVLDMELKDVLILKCSQFEPRCFLICPHQEALVSHMQNQGLYGEVPLRAVPSQIDTYLQMHKDRPGFFCAAIRSDDLDKAYRTLRTLVCDYLGVKENHNGFLDNIRGTLVPVESHQKPPLHRAKNFINAWRQSSQTVHNSFQCHHTTAKYMELSHKYCGMRVSFRSMPVELQKHKESQAGGGSTLATLQHNAPFSSAMMPSSKLITFTTYSQAAPHLHTFAPSSDTKESLPCDEVWKSIAVPMDAGLSRLSTHLGSRLLLPQTTPPSTYNVSPAHHAFH